MSAAKLASSVLAATLAACWMGCFSPALTRVEATSLAEQQLGDYVEAESLDRATFGKPAISTAPGHPWVFDYTSDTLPRHLLRIYVNSREDVEIHRMIEE